MVEFAEGKAERIRFLAAFDAKLSVVEPYFRAGDASGEGPAKGSQT